MRVPGAAPHTTHTHTPPRARTQPPAGGYATRLDIPGAEHAVTSDEALALDTLPGSSVLIVGSG